jgi:hypothetical protein
MDATLKVVVNVVKFAAMAVVTVATTTVVTKSALNGAATATSALKSRHARSRSPAIPANARNVARARNVANEHLLLLRKTNSLQSKYSRTTSAIHSQHY